jgi:hypothetical protein
MNNQILKELAEVNFHLRKLRAEIQKLVSALARVEADKTTAATATSFHKRS